MPRRLFFVEPSKVRTYHITLVDGWLAALTSSRVVTRAFDVIVAASRSTFANLSADVRNRVTYEPIPVIDQDRHQVVRKSLLEFFVVLRYMLRARADEPIFVSCLIPSALVLLEIANRILRKKNVFVVVHGEIEALLAAAPPHWRKIGFWAVCWYRTRRRGSLISVVVIDDFIKATLINSFPEKLTDRSVFVVHHPVRPVPAMDGGFIDPAAVCFIGYRSPAKGYGEFEKLATGHPDLRFLAIGAGKIEDIRTHHVGLITGIDQFFAAISRCSIAIFPYTADYDCSLSAALLDALSAGLQILGTPRAMFESLSEELGPEFVTVCRNSEDFGRLLGDQGWVMRSVHGRQERLSRLAVSKYAGVGIREDFERLLSYGGYCSTEQSADHQLVSPRE